MAKTTAQQILDYWYYHEIYQFKPLDIPWQREHKKFYFPVRCFSDPMPWQQEPPLTFDDYVFEVYLGIASETAVGRYLAGKLGVSDYQDQFVKRGNGDKITYMGMVRIETELGYVRIDKAEISSLFWALAQTEIDRWPNFSGFAAYRSWLDDYCSERVAPYFSEILGAQFSGLLFTKLLTVLQGISIDGPMYQVWCPDEEPLAIIHAKPKLSQNGKFHQGLRRVLAKRPERIDYYLNKIRQFLPLRQDLEKREVLAEAFDEEIGTELEAIAEELGFRYANEYALEEEVRRVFAMPPFEILNSFYLEDMSEVMTMDPKRWPDTIKSVFHFAGRPETTLAGARFDLFAEDYKDTVLSEVTCSSTTPIGRWPVGPERLMSLMQQYAINRCADPAEPSAVLSVNGPPGTGKTTLLKDVIAAKVCERAAVLAKLAKPADGFATAHKKKLSSGFPVYPLIDELKGYEIVIACNTNKAAENLSKTLPRKDEVDDRAFAELSWLGELTRRFELAGLSKADLDGAVTGIKPSADQLWGLISVALGSSANNEELRRRIAGDSQRLAQTEDEARRGGPYTSLGAWLNRPSKMSFGAAKKQFKACQADVRQRLAEAEALWQRWQRALASGDQARLERDAAKLERQIASDERSHAEWFEVLTRAQKEVDDCQPSLLSRFFGLSREERKALAAAVAKRQEAGDEYRALATRLSQKRRELDELLDRLEEGETRQDILAELDDELGKQLAACELPLDADNLQLATPLQTPALNRARSELFVAALKLHEAWLDAIKNSHLKTLCYSFNLLFKPNLKDRDHEQARLELLHLVFMLFPAISSTLASFRRSFSHVPKGRLGLALVDEAGQATPQSVLGVLLRCRKVIAVGDPMQIEPIVDLPDSLQDAITRYFAEDKIAKIVDWQPRFLSVQTLFDRSHPYAARTGVDTLVGMPLRVHRRCASPMFETANELAYDGKMIQAIDRPATAHPILGSSRWLNVSGRAKGPKNHWVPAQGDVVLQMILALQAPLTTAEAKQRAMADVFVISPFREVGILFGKAARLSGLPQRDIGSWLQDHVGTVHTFQGKEAAIVFLLLGLDDSGHGSGNRMIAGKPNVPNVAITRAKNHAYIVGDYGVWGDIAPFEAFADWPREQLSQPADSLVPPREPADARPATR